MALLTADELQGSREAIQAGVTSVSDEDANDAIEEAELALYARLGYSIETDVTEVTVTSRRSRVLWLPERARTFTEIEEDGTTYDLIDWTLIADGFAIDRYYGVFAARQVTVTGTFGYTEDDREWKLAKKWVRIAAVDYLSQSASGSNRPVGLESYTAEGASFRFQGSASLRSDLQALIEEIGVHPNKRNSIVPVQMQGTL